MPEGPKKQEGESAPVAYDDMSAEQQAMARANVDLMKATPEQIEKAKEVAEERLKAMDTNKDGVLTFEEVMAHYQGVDSQVKEALKLMFKENDYNGDGVVSKRELFQLALRLIMLGAL